LFNIAYLLLLGDFKEKYIQLFEFYHEKNVEMSRTLWFGNLACNLCFWPVTFKTAGQFGQLEFFVIARPAPHQHLNQRP